MVNVTQLLALDLNKLHSAAESWRWIAWRLNQAGDEVDDAVTQPIKTGTKWSGDDAKAAASKLEGIHKDIQAVAKEAKAVGTFINDVATGTGDGAGSLKKHQDRARELVSEARSHGLWVEGDGTVTWQNMRSSDPLSPAAQQQLKQMQDTARTLGIELKKVLTAVNSIDGTLTYGLKGIFGTKDTFRTEDRNRHTGGRGPGTSWTEIELTGVIAGLRWEGWNDAADLLKHYLDGGGEPYQLDVDRMLKEIPKFQTDLSTTLEQMKNRPDGKFQSDWTPTLAKHDDGNKSMNWYYALHHFQYRVIGEKHGADMTYHVEVRKRYDWGTPSEHHRPLSKAGIHLEQPDIARLNMVGEAQDFDVTGRTSTMRNH
jgi:hypothetical protein